VLYIEDAGHAAPLLAVLCALLAENSIASLSFESLHFDTVSWKVGIVVNLLLFFSFD